jgi:hypothetical protein
LLLSRLGHEIHSNRSATIRNHATSRFAGTIRVISFLFSFFSFSIKRGLAMDSETLELCAGLVDAPYVRAAVQARAQRQALIKNLLSHVQSELF